MKFMKEILINVLFSFVFLSNCQNTDKQIFERNNYSVKTIFIPKAQNADDLEIIDDLSYILLEDKVNSLLGYVTKIRVHKKRLFVLDNSEAESLFIYTIDGNHITTIGNNKGRGPYEFLSVSNFEIDFINDQLLVMDNWGRKFMIYDLDGRFIKKIDSEIPVDHAVLLPNGYIMHAKSSFDYKIPNQSNSSIIITDDKNHILKEGFEYDDNENLNITSYGILCTQHDGSVNFAPKFRDTIYSVSFDSIVPKYAIHYGNNKKISRNQMKDLNSVQELIKLINAGNMCFLGDQVESKDYLFFSLGRSRYQTYVFYNKQTTNTIALFQRANITDYKYELYKILCSDSEGYFYGAFNHTTFDKLNKLFPELQKIDRKDLNPILFRYKIKNGI